MTPSERIAAIREISRILAQEEWAFLDLTLRQFGLPTNDQWSGDKLGYVIQMIDGATGDQLSDLAAHLGVSNQQDLARAVDFPFWQPEHFRLFVSHVSTCKDLAEELRTCFGLHYVSAFVAHSDIEPTREWLEQIEGALATADALLAILTTDFHQSLWTDQEVGVAIGRSILVIPLRMGRDPYGLFGKLQGLSGHEKTPGVIARETVEALLKNKSTTKKMTYSLVTRLANSSSWEGAKHTMSLIEMSDYLDPILAARMRESIQRNSQVRFAFGVPERIESLIARRIQE